jgi:N-acylneuraminate cytidylyltransferase
VPRKNILPFDGKPMVAWTIEAALRSGLFSAVYVSTDDEETADVARRFGAEVPFLRSAFCDAQSPVSLATAQMAAELLSRNHRFDAVCQLFAVCPLRTAEDIVDAWRAFEASGAPSQISCFEYSGPSPWWAMVLDESGHGRPLFPEQRLARSQDLAPLYCPTGAVWCARLETLLAERTFYAAGHRYHPLPWKRAIDIDTWDDVALALALRRLHVEGGPQGFLRMSQSST